MESGSKFLQVSQLLGAMVSYGKHGETGAIDSEMLRYIWIFSGRKLN